MRDLQSKEGANMKIYEYCSVLDVAILQFTFAIIEDIREKITERKLFYREQINRYLQKRIALFLQQQNQPLKGALLQVYKSELYNTIMFKLNKELKEHQILFQCV